jgi:UTP--glucose-1-phosphate uridylyltransferase
MRPNLNPARCALLPVRKAVILAAGYGTRMLPATKAMPKEMLVLVDRPVIHYAVEELAKSGIEQVIIVTAAGKGAIEDYFDRSRDIEDLLQRKNDSERLEQVRQLTKMANISYVRQPQAKGLADAVNTARAQVGDEPFVLVLPDIIVTADIPATRQLLNCYEAHQVSVVAVAEVPEAEVSSFGIVAGDAIDDRVTKLSHMVEKPPVGGAPSRLAIVGRYVLTPSIWGAIDRIEPGWGGELQITDALHLLAAEEGMYAYRLEGAWLDTGRPLEFLQASIELALRRPDVAPGLRQYLQSLNLDRES